MWRLYPSRSTLSPAAAFVSFVAAREPRVNVTCAVVPPSTPSLSLALLPPTLAALGVASFDSVGARPASAACCEAPVAFSMRIVAASSAAVKRYWAPARSAAVVAPVRATDEKR